MHDTAHKIGSLFFASYAMRRPLVILEIGAININGSLREVCPEGCFYIGVDVELGPDVDLIVKVDKALPFRPGFADIVVSTSQMEHDPRFWMTFLELCRAAKNGGLIYINVPSNGIYHAFPSDNWRFYPDAGKALASWARENHYEITLLESFTAQRQEDAWNDFVCVFFVGQWPDNQPIEFLADQVDASNIWKYGIKSLQNPSTFTEDQRLIYLYREERDMALAELAAAKKRITQLEAE